ncbi:hypothetical protein pb186bvf_008741 [Paramecium bursaria]
MIIDLPLIVIRTPYLQQQLYIESMNLLIGRSTSRYFAWDIKENQLQLNNDISILIESQQKVMTLPNKFRVLGQDSLHFTVYDLKNCNIISQHNIGSYYYYAINTDISSQKLFLDIQLNYFKSIYSINNWKKQLLCQKLLNSGLFGKYTYCLYNIDKKNIYRSKINKIIRVHKIFCFKLQYNDEFMIYENQDIQRKQGVKIKDNVRLSVQYFSMERQLIAFEFIYNFILITQGSQLMIIDKSSNQIIKQKAIDIEKRHFELCNYIGCQTDKCIYLFTTSQKYKI